ncbi:2-hydroxyacid dehydrogenase [Azospirillum rugosum]|uniref:Glyoxylate/hydroxypyruvate reductase A n=2 Tax=Azospirillum rugosum TaxID=416170 RepID=A0ABS4SJV8_9PROT|nr:glyoxylate/hydroxypyruvate reductase A [Azospirillum rugosum]MBP2292839.1 glyoxylate/hydroxypyruvate reductase A [Azospirillum rugosum]MDQ0529409.1 glyoxylate/hydroxypyruvate reductase A [Azospirillum rugosum]
MGAGKILFSSDIDDPVAWGAAVRALRPDLEVVDWRAAAEPEAFEFALLWKPPPGGLGPYRNLKAIQSLGAGINQLDLSTLPPGLPLARLIDPHLTETMVDYAVTAVYRHFRGFDRFERQGRERRWAHEEPPTKADFPVGVMGLGVLGGAVAQRIRALGFPVTGWSRSRHPIDGIEVFAGREELPAFLASARGFVCVLALTEHTAGILNRETMGAMRPGSCIINMGRGGHLVEGDLAALVRAGHIAGATLDVLSQEPVPADHPFYDLPEILVTPHVAGGIAPRSAAPIVIENFDRAMAGTPLLNLVDPARGY